MQMQTHRTRKPMNYYSPRALNPPRAANVKPSGGGKLVFTGGYYGYPYYRYPYYPYAYPYGYYPYSYGYGYGYPYAYTYPYWYGYPGYTGFRFGWY